MKKLHEKQQVLLKLLKDNMHDPLTMEELKDRLGVKSKSVVFHHIKQLESKGYLKRNPSNTQDYQVLEDPEHKIGYINLYGMAQCGPNGSFLDGKPVKTVPVDPKMIPIPLKDAFMVEARGDSMEPEIYEKDWVIAQKNAQPKRGDIVVCVNDGAVLIKEYDISGEQIILISKNSKTVPNKILPNKDEIRIAGVVKSIIKRSIN